MNLKRPSSVLNIKELEETKKRSPRTDATRQEEKRPQTLLEAIAETGMGSPIWIVSQYEHNETMYISLDRLMINSHRTIVG
jgi:hypothetical protein